jgi:hypothetical protein
MTTHGTKYFRRCLTLAAVIALLAAFSLTSATSAATSGDVTVTADIGTFNTSLTLTLCDQTADFGTGLNAFGDPAVSTDVVQAFPDSAGLPNGATYQWTPSCATGAHFFMVDSNVSWTSTVCATAGTYSSSLALSDLSANIGGFQTCPPAFAWTGGSPGTTFYDIVYYLRVDPSDTAGSFAATTTWAVTSG